MFPSHAPSHAHQGRRNGSYAVIIALALVPLMGLLALAFDLSYLQNVSYEVQNAAEAGAHAGACGLKYGRLNDVGATAAADKVLRSNFIEGKPVDPPRMVDYTPCYWDGSSCSATALPHNALQVKVNRTIGKGRPVQLYFTQLYGLASSDVTATSTAAIRNWDVMFVMDVSRAMEPSIPAARTGALQFLDNMRNNPLDAIGMVTVTGVAADASNTSGTLWQQLTPLLDAFTTTTVRNRFNSLALCYSPYPAPNTNTQMPRCDAPLVGSRIDQGNNLGHGMLTAMDELVDWSSPGSFKAMVMVSNRSPNNGPLTPTYRADATAAADLAWLNHIHVYVVFQNSTASTAEATFMRSLIRGNGTYQEAAAVTDLPTAIGSLAMEVPIAVVK